MTEKTLFVLAAPSGTGKTTIAEQLLLQDEAITRSVSCTTRPMRASEKQGTCYHFIDEAGFLDKVENGDLLEFAKIYGHFYGTPRHSIKQAFEDGKDVLLVLDWQGAQQIKKSYTDCVSIFLIPPSYQDLLQRMQNRGEDSDAAMARRLQNALQEFSHYREFDYLVVNENLDTAVQQVQAIIHAERLKTKRQEQKYAGLVQKLHLEMQNAK